MLLKLHRVGGYPDPALHIGDGLPIDGAEPVWRTRLQNQDITRTHCSS